MLAGQSCLPGCTCGRHKGHPHTEEHKAHMSQVQLTVWKDKREERLARHLEIHKGSKRPPETCQKLSDKAKGRDVTPESIAAMVLGLDKYWNGENGEANRAACGERRRQYYQEHPEFLEQRRTQLAGRRLQSPTDIERYLLAFLTEEYPGLILSQEHRIGRYSIDCAIPSERWAFEADEPMWHDDERDRIRDAFLASQGWKTSRINSTWLRRWARRRGLC